MNLSGQSNSSAYFKHQFTSMKYQEIDKWQIKITSLYFMDLFEFEKRTSIERRYGLEKWVKKFPWKFLSQSSDFYPLFSWMKITLSSHSAKPKLFLDPETKKQRKRWIEIRERGKAEKVQPKAKGWKMEVTFSFSFILFLAFSLNFCTSNF